MAYDRVRTDEPIDVVEVVTQDGEPGHRGRDQRECARLDGSLDGVADLKHIDHHLRDDRGACCERTNLSDLQAVDAIGSLPAQEQTHGRADDAGEDGEEMQHSPIVKRTPCQPVGLGVLLGSNSLVGTSQAGIPTKITPLAMTTTDAISSARQGRPGSRPSGK